MRQRRNVGRRRNRDEDLRSGTRHLVIPGVLSQRSPARILCIYCFTVGRCGGELTVERDRRPLITRQFFEQSYDAADGADATALTRCMECEREIVFDAVVANAFNNRLDVLGRGDPRVAGVIVNVRDHGGANTEVKLKNGYVISLVPHRYLTASDQINIRVYQPAEIKAGGQGVGFEDGQFVDAKESSSAVNIMDDVFQVIDMITAPSVRR